MIGCVSLSASLLGGCRPADNGLAIANGSEQALTVNVMRILREPSAGETAVYYGKLEPVRSSQPRFGKPGVIKAIQPQGSRVATGETLAVLNQDELESRRATLQASLRSLQESAADAAQIVPLENQLRELQQQLDQGILLAPWDCLVTERYQDEGDTASPQMPLLRVVETVPPRVVMHLPRRVADRLRMDQKLWVFIGKQPVESVVQYRSIEETSAGSKTVWLSIASNMQNIPWAFGQSVEVRFTLDNDQSGFWLPLSALNRDASGLWSLLVVSSDRSPQDRDAEGVAPLSRKLVNLLSVQNEWALVDGALQENEQVVVNGLHRIVAGQMVRVSDVTEQWIRPGVAGEGE